MSTFPLSTRPVSTPPVSTLHKIGHAVRAFWRELTREFRDPYRPERHYMRGPGPKWSERHAGSAGA